MEIKDIVRKAQENFLFRTLSSEGPEGLARSRGISPREKGYVGKCHLCYEVLSDMMKN